MNDPIQLKLHHAQSIILESLRHNPIMRYAQLQKAAGMDSDVFKFHIRRLISLGLINKIATGSYGLTFGGKKFANNLSEKSRNKRQQAKQSLLLVVQRTNDDGSVETLTQQRLRQPYYGMHGLISGPLPWGKTVEEAAHIELLKQTGLNATFEVQAFYHQLAYLTNGELIEDILFTILTATVVKGLLINDWYAGHNEWIAEGSTDELENSFTTVSVVRSMLQNGEMYRCGKVTYTDSEY